MFIIGITGGSGGGKTSALRALENLGALVLDCDAIYHRLLSDNTGLKSELADRFPGVLHNGVIDRKQLGDTVFRDPLALDDLNKITHRYIGAEIEREIADFRASGGKVAAIDAIALIESGRSRRCDVVVGVIAPKELRISRIMARDGISREQAELRINAQKPDSFYRKNCDHILEGIYDTSQEFEEICKDFFGKLIGGITIAG